MRSLRNDKIDIVFVILNKYVDLSVLSDIPTMTVVLRQKPIGC